MNDPDRTNNSQDKPGACDSCGFNTEALKAYRVFPMSRFLNTTHKWLCDLCASTMTGCAHEYPDQYPGVGAVMKTVCYVGNVLRQEIEKLQVKSESQE